MKSRLTQYLATHFPGIQTVVSSREDHLRMICTGEGNKAKSDKIPFRRITEFCHGNISAVYTHTHMHMETQTFSQATLDVLKFSYKQNRILSKHQPSATTTCSPFLSGQFLVFCIKPSCLWYISLDN